MTTQYIVKADNSHIEVTCRNHACSDVCRGVSALIYALVNKLRFDEAQNRIENLSVKLEAGDAKVRFDVCEGYMELECEVLKTINIGMQGIAARYPEELTVEII